MCVLAHEGADTGHARFGALDCGKVSCAESLVGVGRVCSSVPTELNLYVLLAVSLFWGGRSV